MGELFQPTHVLIIGIAMLIILSLIIIPYWMIFKKAGFPPAISLLMFFPLLNLIILYVIAFSRWKVVPVSESWKYPAPGSYMPPPIG